MRQNTGDLAAAITEVVAASALPPAEARDLVRVTEGFLEIIAARSGRAHLAGNGAETKGPPDPI
jgi:hypothetical protein